MLYSNITQEDFSKLFKKAKEKNIDAITLAKKHVVKPSRTTDCQFAEDTGSLAMPNRPCKGNRIICHHADNDGMVTYAKLCNHANCKFYIKKL